MNPNDTTNNEIPYGYCKCGCGQKTALATHNRVRRNYTQMKGEPSFFIRGHRVIQPLSERFWSKVDKSGGDDACWIWTGSIARDYGSFSVKHVSSTPAHRVAWELTHGAIPDGLLALHKCDNPPCVNPAHLFLGTQLDNMRDKMSKGRAGTVHGADTGHAKLTEDQVREIRQRHAETDVTYVALGKEYGVSWFTIQAAVKRKAWKHVID